MSTWTRERERAYFAMLGQCEGMARGHGLTVERLTTLESHPLEVAMRPIGQREAEPTIVQAATPEELIAAVAALPDHVTTTRHS